MKFEKYKATNAFKLDLLSDAEFEGKYDMPVVKPVHNVEPVNLLPFHIALSNNTPDQHWYHFYEDDYQFERFWKCPSKYIPLLSRFTGGIGPDYSLYLGMPRSQQIWNCWRNKVMTFHMQKKGLLVIPNVGWSDESSYDWAFDGLPSNSVLSITTQGCMGNDYECKRSLLNGLYELARRKHPEKLIVYGSFPEAWRDRFSMPIVVLNTFSQERWGKKHGQR